MGDIQQEHETNLAELVGDDLARAADLLRGGGLVAFGTETVYGLGADATNAHAIARVFEAKGRPSFDPLIVHAASVADVRSCVRSFPRLAEQLADAFWPGPLTIVLPRHERIVDLVTSGLPTVGVRVPLLDQTRSLLAEAGRPIAAPSANLFGEVSPTMASHVVDQLGDRVDYVVDTGPCPVGVESTVVRIDDDQVILLRPGGVTREQIEGVTGPLVIARDDQKGEMLSPDSPGQLPRHYSPGVPLHLGRPLESSANDGLLAFGADSIAWTGPVATLSAHDDLAEAATNLFAAMRQLKAAGVRAIYVDDIPEIGLGVAINDRLRRAAAS